MSLEIRDLSGDKIQQIFEMIKSEALEIAKKTGTKISFHHLDVSAIPAPTNKMVRDAIIESTKELALSYKIMPSGAGHDAQDMAKITPTGMIFVPSVGGISHSPDEFTLPEDMANGTNVLLHTILRLDASLD